MALLSVRNLRVTYDDVLAVQSVSFDIAPGEIFVLVGPNGAGKTSILRAISGLVSPNAGEIRGKESSLLGKKPHQVAQTGISHVPEGRRVFPHLSVAENLTVSFIPKRASGTSRKIMDDVYALFPRLHERRGQAAGTLSGGEQQMLAIGRALMNTPDLIMLDEPSLGLSPVVTDTMFEKLAEIRSRGMAILLVEQNIGCIELATRGLILIHGNSVLDGDQSVLRNSDFVKSAYLSI
jgi:branched-chain amino acid transport system ATP-binding protein